MKKEDIKTLTIIGSEVIINGVGNTITLSLEDGIEAVQYHKGYRILEEPLMKEVEFEKYQEFIDEWQKVEDMKNIIQVQTSTDSINILSLSPRQARLILLQYNLLDDIEAMLLNDRAMQIWWEYSLEIRRDNLYIITACANLGLTDEQLDTMFVDGSSL